jgi:hypothetical protein
MASRRTSSGLFPVELARRGRARPPCHMAGFVVVAVDSSIPNHRGRSGRPRRMAGRRWHALSDGAAAAELLDWAAVNKRDATCWGWRRGGACDVHSAPGPYRCHRGGGSDTSGSDHKRAGGGGYCPFNQMAIASSIAASQRRRAPACSERLGGGGSESEHRTARRRTFLRAPAALGAGRDSTRARARCSGLPSRARVY